MPQDVAALSAVSSMEAHVKTAFDAEDFSWYVSSEELYVEFAGDEIPERLCTAQERGRLSNCEASALDIDMRFGLQKAHRVVGKDSNDFVPLRSFVWRPVEILC